jgi:hypothetical protein
MTAVKADCRANACSFSLTTGGAVFPAIIAVILQRCTPTLAVALKLMDPQQQAAVKLRHMALAYVHQNSWLARPANHRAGRCLHVDSNTADVSPYCRQSAWSNLLAGTVDRTLPDIAKTWIASACLGTAQYQEGHGSVNVKMRTQGA